MCKVFWYLFLPPYRLIALLLEKVPLLLLQIILKLDFNDPVFLPMLRFVFVSRDNMSKLFSLSGSFFPLIESQQPEIIRRSPKNPSQPSPKIWRNLMFLLFYGFARFLALIWIYLISGHGSGSSTVVEHTPMEQNSWGWWFESCRMLRCFSSLSIPQ